MKIVEMSSYLVTSLTPRIPGFRHEEVPQPERTAPGKLVESVDLLLGLLAWSGTAAGVAGVLITGAMMAISHKRGETSEHLSRLGMVLAGCVLVATSGPIVQFFF